MKIKIKAIVIDEEPCVSLSQFKDLTVLNEAALEQNKLLDKRLNQALADIAEHGRTIVELQQELVNEREGKKKVEIPREVAEAIEQLRESDLSDHGIMHFIDRSNDVVDSKRRESFKVLRRFTFLDSAHYTNGCDFLINALVNGYTIEQSPEEKLAEGIMKICEEFNSNHPDDVDFEDIFSLAFKISDFVQNSSEHKS